MNPVRVNFLAAADGTPLTKQYSLLPTGEYEIKPYPMVRNFNSFEYQVDNLTDWFTAIKAHSELNHCFLKGTLDQKLVNESRAGHTNPMEPTSTIVLDLDFFDGFKDFEDFLSKLDPMFKDVSYIRQHSTSAGIKGAAGLRGHLFFLTTKPQNLAQLKIWLQYKNLTVPALVDRLELTASGMSLRFPLDVTTCQSDKIIYTALPLCDNFEDPIRDDRLVVVQKGQEHLSWDAPFLNPQLIQEMTDDKVQELRAAAGLKKRGSKYGVRGGKDVLQNPDTATVTGVKEGRGFIYLNLNGGDSWGYFHNKNNPDLLMNFKGEPTCRLKDIVPDYFAGLLNADGAKEKPVPMVIRDRNEDKYYNFIYDPGTKTYDSLDPVARKDSMEDFMEQNGAMLPDPIEDWTLGFDPRTLETVDFRRKWINRFRPTKFLRTNFGPVAKPPMVIDKILSSICVDNEYKAWFINWLAYIYQYRDKTGTAPLFHGTQGTGKGLFQEKVLIPLFGGEHTPKLTSKAIADPFNSWSHACIIATWDEAEHTESYNNTVYDMLKNLITEEHTSVRKMRTDGFTIRSFLNLLVFTNHPLPLPLDVNDRRFSPAPAQTTPIDITGEEIDIIKDELEIFAAYLQHYPVSTHNAKRVLRNEAREIMIRGSASTVDRFFIALKMGNLGYFLGFLKPQGNTVPDLQYNAYQGVLRKWTTAYEREEQTIISPADAMVVYSHIIGKYDSPAKFRKMAEKYRLTMDRKTIDGERLSGWSVIWGIKDEDKDDLTLLPRGDVKQLKLAK